MKLAKADLALYEAAKKNKEIKLFCLRRKWVKIIISVVSRHGLTTKEENMKVFFASRNSPMLRSSICCMILDSERSWDNS
jgi:hypothetical protein